MADARDVQEEPPTVGSLLEASGRRMRKQLPDDSPMERLLGAAGAAADALDGVELDGGPGTVLALLEEMLAIPIPDVLVEGWRRYEPFLELADPRRHPPGTVHQVPLAEHVVESTWNPAVELLLDGVRAARVEFDVYLKLVLEGATVTVRDGRFRSVSTGTCTFQGKVRLGELVLAERGPEALELPGTLELGADGIPVAPPSPLTPPADS